jgi:hypothetical protein
VGRLPDCPRCSNRRFFCAKSHKIRIVLTKHFNYPI